MRRLMLGALLLPLSGIALAHDFAFEGLQIDHPWIRATPPGATVAGGYLSITNTGSTTDRLLSVTTVISPPASIHETMIEDGVARMVPLSDGLVIPQGETVTLDPLGVHIMFEELAAPLAAGTTIDAILVFEIAGEVSVVFNVEPIGALAPATPHHGG